MRQKIWLHGNTMLVMIMGLVFGLFNSAQAVILDPATITKYGVAMVIPPAMPRTDLRLNASGKPSDYYEIAVRQFQQQVLPTPLPVTTVWGYGSLANTATFNFPAFTIEAKVDKPVIVKWINQLVDISGSHNAPAKRVA
jgi:bilirubin oxidase